MEREGFAQENIEFHRTVGLRFRLQMHEVITPVPPGRITEEVLEKVYAEFAELYERKHGKGSAYKEAGMEIISFQLRAVGRLPKTELRMHEETGADPEQALNPPPPRILRRGERGHRRVSVRPPDTRT